MLRDLLKEGGLYTLANLLTKGISLLLIPFYTAYFAPTDYGVIEMITVFGFFVTGVLTLQLSQGLSRFVAEPTKTEAERISYASSAIWGAFIFMSLSFTFLAIYPEWVMNILFGDSNSSLKLYYFALTSIFLNAFYYFFGVYFRFTRKTKLFSLLSLIYASLNIFFTWLLVYKYNMGIISIYIAYIIVLPFLLTAQYYILRKEIILKIDKSHLKELLKYCLPIIPVSIALIVMNFTDRLFIKHYIDFSELGIYGVAAKFASIIGVFIASFSMAISPLILQKHNQQKTRNELSRIFRLFIAITTLSVLTLSVFSYETVYLFTNENYLSAYEVMPILYMSTVFLGAQMFAPGLMIKKKSVLMALVTISFSLINVVLNYFFIPLYGLVGAATATLISIIGQQTTFFAISQKLYPFSIDKNKVTVLIFISFSAAFLLNKVFANSYTLTLAIKTIAIVGYTFLLFKMKFISAKKIKGLFKKLRRGA